MKWRPWYREVGDQLLHALWAGVSVWLCGLGTFGLVVGVFSLVCLIAREIEQWPPNKERPWDPLLDAGGYLVGAIVGFLV